MKLEALHPGVRVYDVGRTKLGNTTLTTVSVWPVVVTSVDLEKRTVMASWNGNAARTFRENSWKKWKVQAPVLIDCGMGRKRLPTREERADLKNKNQDPSA